MQYYYTMSVIELNNAIVLDLESALTNRKVKEERKQTCYSMLCVFLCLSFIIVPLSVVSIYLAYTDDSCMNKTVGFHVTLGDYLKVDGILYGLGLFFWTTNLTFIKIIVKHSSCFSWIYIVSTLFTLSWSIIGTIILSKVIEYCREIIRQWVITLLTIHYVSFVGFCYMICVGNL